MTVIKPVLESVDTVNSVVCGDVLLDDGVDRVNKVVLRGRFPKSGIL